MRRLHSSAPLAMDMKLKPAIAPTSTFPRRCRCRTRYATINEHARRVIMDLKETPHRRYNPLTRAWVLVSPHRTQRPWSGSTEATAPSALPRYDPSCYLCSGNGRAAGAHNPPYTSTFVFENDYPALSASAPDDALDNAGLIVARGERGICRVVCFSPPPDLAIPRMTAREVR